MKILFTLSASFLIASMAYGKSVTMESARQVADNYFKQGSLLKNLTIADAFSETFKGITTYYVFNYSGGGFVIVSADDAVIPILAESSTGYFDSIIINPSVKYWFDGYNQQIIDIITSNLDNTQTLKEWSKIKSNTGKNSFSEVGPLLTTTWDQNCFYNAYCPPDGGPCGRVWTGCVATTMSQLMKYHGFPEHGFLSNSYFHHQYYEQNAEFNTTNYNWSAMPNSVTSANPSVATIMYHAGVAVNMKYGPDGSGAHSEDVPWALVAYFNYDPSTIAYKERNNFTETEWSNIIKSELDAGRPIFYSGTDGTTGHAWVCDGYRNSDDKFHMNWGWSGAANGYYAIGSLNPNKYKPNQNNSVVVGIKPGNSKLVARITNITNNKTFTIDSRLAIDVNIVEGFATTVKLIVDSTEVYSTSHNKFIFNWNANSIGLGFHILKVVAFNESDTVCFPVTIGINNWSPQVSGFSYGNRVQYIDAVDSLVAWATSYDGSLQDNYLKQKFTRTINGGKIWTPGIITNTVGLLPSMIFALNADIAYCPMYLNFAWLVNPVGIYVTRDRGLTWSRQTSALFDNKASFPNVVHFFNKNEGWCMGDPVNGEFECYTTINGGNTWSRVPGEYLPDPISGEYGIVAYYSAVGNNVWFGTNKGRVYRSGDKGYKWDVSYTTFSNNVIDVEFATPLHGLAQVRDTAATGALSETFDGGITWHSVASKGPLLAFDLKFVPGTENTWVSTGVGANAKGASYSFDGGHTWQLFKGSELTQYLATDWVNNRNGWAGGYSVNYNDGGMYKFTGILQPLAPLASPENLKVIASGNNVKLNWEVPLTLGRVTGYNIYRDGVLLSTTTDLFYNDNELVNGFYKYCISALYVDGESVSNCITTSLSIDDNEQPERQVNMYPNPSMDILNIESTIPFSSVQIYNFAGHLVYSNNFNGYSKQILTSAFDAGIYLVCVKTKNGFITRKISVQ